MSEMEIIVPNQKTDRWLPNWKRYLKKIPKRGLNNLTKPSIYLKKYYAETGQKWKGVPTIQRRLEKICIGGLFWDAVLPFFYYHMEMRTNGNEVENLEKVQKHTKQILERLEILYENMDTVTVLSPEKVEYWKERIRKTELHIRKQSRWIGLNLIQETDYRVIESFPLLQSTLLKETDA